MEPRRLVVRYGRSLACELLAVVRDHHASMPGPARDRPGADRVRLRLPDGSETVVDLWSRSGQDVAQAPREIEVFDEGELLCWRPAAQPAEVLPAATPAPRLRLTG